MRFAILLILAIVVVFAGVTGIFPEANHATEAAWCVDPSGFWSGLAHGFLLFWTALASIWFDNGVYETCNAGGWYDFGYLLGVMFWFGGASSSSSSSSSSTSNSRRQR
jgi:hypothetical protein